jgi:hypothetical protein
MADFYVKETSTILVNTGSCLQRSPPIICHSERSEESQRYQQRLFASLRVTNLKWRILF